MIRIVDPKDSVGFYTKVRERNISYVAYVVSIIDDGKFAIVKVVTEPLRNEYRKVSINCSRIEICDEESLLKMVMDLK